MDRLVALEFIPPLCFRGYYDLRYALPILGFIYNILSSASSRLSLCYFSHHWLNIKHTHTATQMEQRKILVVFEDKSKS